MAVVENAGPKNDVSSQNLEANNNDLERSSKPRNDKESPAAALASKGKGGGGAGGDGVPQQVRANGQRPQEEEDEGDEVVVGVDGYTNTNTNDDNKSNGHLDHDHDNHEISELVEILSKLNPLAKEFVPPSLVNGNGYLSSGFGFANNFVLHTSPGNANGLTNRRKRNSYRQRNRRMNNRTSEAQQEEMIRRTVYVSDIDQQVTEEQLAGLFASCGQVVDCRVCGDPNSVLRFAFVEFTDEESARAALILSGTVLGFYPLGVLPSKTAIAPVNPTFLPRSEDEREMCARTIYCTNIDRKVSHADVRLFFESYCGEVLRLRILGDHRHSTRIAFIEFAMAESAIAALNCSGAVLGTLPIRVSPSKTPVRSRVPPH